MKTELEANAQSAPASDVGHPKPAASHEEATEKRPTPDTLYETNGVPAKKLKSENGEAAPVKIEESPTASSNGTDLPNGESIASAAVAVETASESIDPTNDVSPETTTTTSDNSWGSRPRRSAVAARASVREAIKPKTTKKQKKVETTEEEFKTAWICCECKEAECMMHPDADTLLICEGTCRRLFHYPCAGLSKPPTEEESYICQDCRKGQHICALCQSYGIDNEDVFACCATKCGLYYHEACLQMRDVEVKLVPPSTTAADNGQANAVQEGSSEGTRKFRREFKCPAHCCWTCTQKDMVEKERKEAAESRKAEKKKGRKKSKPASAAFGQKPEELTIVSKDRDEKTFVWLVQFLTACPQLHSC